ncbi:WXG100 family type VII secretion target [Nocardia fusca]|uniref:WXG100 family type VII secretion target n=1 Tax=Nocardia fusca TaxID=941183 RepID=UPI0037C7C8B9
MSDAIAYSEAQLMALSGDLNTSRGRLQETHDELQGYVNGLVAQWGGDAQVAYSAKQKRWDDAHIALLEIMHRLSEIVRDGAIDMTTTDKSNAARWM